MTNRETARKLLAAAAGRKIVVVGDLMLDQFIWGSVERISPEAPVPVVKVSRESFHLGGAGNVVSNLVSLGGAPHPVGVTGSGPEAARLRETLAAMGVPSDGVLEVAGRSTTVKTRVVAHSQQVVRFDREQDDPLDEKSIARLTSTAIELCRTADALVVSDYEKGCVTSSLLAKLLPAARARKIPVIVDPKPGQWRSYTPVTVITPNQTEASRMSGLKLRDDAESIAAAKAILEVLECEGVLLTRGDKGMLLVERDGEPFAVAATTREVFDVTGAGDTVVAALALCLSAGATLRDAAIVANAAAGVVVAKVGTAVASPEEVIAAL